MIRLLELEIKKLKKKHPNTIIIWGICLKILPKFNKMNIFKKTNWDLLKKLVKFF